MSTHPALTIQTTLTPERTTRQPFSPRSGKPFREPDMGGYHLGSDVTFGACEARSAVRDKSFGFYGCTRCEPLSCRSLAHSPHGGSDWCFRSCEAAVGWVTVASLYPFGAVNGGDPGRLEAGQGPTRVPGVAPWARVQRFRVQYIPFWAEDSGPKPGLAITGPATMRRTGPVGQLAPRGPRAPPRVRHRTGYRERIMAV